MYVLLFAILIGVAGQPRPKSAIAVIKKADAIIVTTGGDYFTATGMMESAGTWGRPLKASITIQAVKRAELYAFDKTTSEQESHWRQRTRAYETKRLNSRGRTWETTDSYIEYAGAQIDHLREMEQRVAERARLTSALASTGGPLTIQGTIQGRKNKYADYLVSGEREQLRVFDAKASDIEFAWKQVLAEYNHREHDYHRTHHGHGSHWHDHRDHIAHIKALKTHRRNRKLRTAERGRLVASFQPNVILRRTEAEIVSVEVTIPESLAVKVNLAKLASAKRFLVTFQVESYTIRPEMPEVLVPPAIGSLTGIVLTVPKKMLLKKGT